MTFHGSVFSAAGQALIAVAADVLPDWNVTYEFPRTPKELVTAIGEPKVVWISPVGSSSFERPTMGRHGWRETCQVTLIFHREHPRSDLPLSDVDDEVAVAFGALLEALSVDPTWSPPDGWGRMDFEPVETNREGGYLPSLTGVVRRLEVSLSVTADRC